MLLNKSHFQKVFPLPEIPTDNDTDLASNWLLNHEHKEPTTRVKTALKNVLASGALWPIILQYIEQMRSQILALDFENVRQVERTRRFFMFPLHFITLEDYEANQFLRALDSLLRFKSGKFALDDKFFSESIGLDTTEYDNLQTEKSLVEQIKQHAGIWNVSFAEKYEEIDLSQKELVSLRINEILDIVKSYPESIPALNDIRQFLDPSQRLQLVNEFTKNCNRYLLHAGSNTDDIILCYISTIRSFLIVDPRGVLLDNASRPIRRYLKDRSDTIPLIVDALMNPRKENKLSVLADELKMVTQIPVNDLHLRWYPDPIDALPDFKKQDIIESLISIFDTKEVFVTEFSHVFADELLSLKSFQFYETSRKLDLLKSKFGEGEFNNLDVMIRDILDSKLTDHKAHTLDRSISRDVQFTILSYMYWPDLPEDEFQVPESIKPTLKQFEDQFRIIRPGRKMKQTKLGSATVQLQLDNKTLKFEVSPPEAAIISLFHNSSGLSLDHVSSSLKMGTELAEKSLSYWVDQSVLKFEDGLYHVLENQKDYPPANNHNKVIPETKASKSTEINTNYWPFVKGMLENLEALSAERIYSFLKLSFSTEKTFGQSPTDVRDQLNTWVTEDRLDLEDGQYKLKNFK
ncbi:hypothetical protein BN7_3928 [Wickerhamomyces ciferrii]|uniref:Anaphase-promoting complex subunit 2 n=1 Tax=Wickerhamomyces ciferrii (strain ATCC 14091 / BCRC 22168 / CBS 111 / JCM 3599 / NBRC 0793 / NRRL Y-1031 F-60-10) TaxID=1206466 RepID=K0KGS1_WICCF|nr:uncharacterized protein BN7_3928 [Wickerhamomyces ciferrii]CCH44365.1 hypothetical protein BN7_3928 [Wickerhamomyces ciferrii]